MKEKIKHIHIYEDYFIFFPEEIFIEDFLLTDEFLLRAHNVIVPRHINLFYFIELIKLVKNSYLFRSFSLSLARFLHYLCFDSNLINNKNGKD